MHYLTSLYMNGLVTCNDMGYKHSTLLIEINVKKLPLTIEYCNTMCRQWY